MELLWPEEGAAHKVHAVYVCATHSPNTWVDITGTIDTKIESLRAYGSQVGGWDPSEKIRERAAREGERANRMRAGKEGGIPDPHSPPVYLEAFRVMVLKE